MSKQGMCRRQAISVRQQLLGDDHEEFLRSLESYAWEPSGWVSLGIPMDSTEVGEMFIIYNSKKNIYDMDVHPLNHAICRL